jgi:cyclic pyranopterin phosphate synthase
VLDVKALMRDGCSDAELFERITDVWRTRVDRYSEQRFGFKDAPRKAEMSVLGG